MDPRDFSPFLTWFVSCPKDQESWKDPGLFFPPAAGSCYRESGPRLKELLQMSDLLFLKKLHLFFLIYANIMFSVSFFWLKWFLVLLRAKLICSSHLCLWPPKLAYGLDNMSFLKVVISLVLDLTEWNF